MGTKLSKTSINGIIIKPDQYHLPIDPTFYHEHYDIKHT